MRCEKDFVGPDGGNLLGETARFRAGATGTAHPRVPSLRDAAARAGLAMRSHLTRRVARARAILIAGAIAVAVLALASPATRRARPRRCSPDHAWLASLTSHSPTMADMKTGWWR